MQSIRLVLVLSFTFIMFACSDASEEVKSDPVPDTQDIVGTWVKSIGSEQSEFIHTSVVDDQGNLYISGAFTGTVNFNPDGLEERTASGTDVFIVKLDSNGNFLWVNTYGGAGFDRGVSLATDSSGIYLLGQMVGSVEFTANNIISTGANNLRGLFLLKLSKLGVFQWVQPLAFGTNDTGILNYYYVGNFMRLGTNAIYITGSFEGQVNFNPQGATADNQTSRGAKDVFIMKLDIAGNRQWAHTIGGTGYDMGHGVIIDNNGAPVFVGHIEGEVDFNPDEIVVNSQTALANPDNNDWATDVFIARFTADGTYVDAKLIGGEQDEWIYGVESDDQGNLYLAGIFQGSADFDPSNEVFRLSSTAPLPDGYDIFLSKFNNNGVHQWTRSFGGKNYAYDSGLSLHINSDNNIFLARCYQSVTRLNPDDTSQEWRSNGSSDVFLSKFTPNGSFQWSKIFGGADWDCATSVSSNGATLFLSGKFEGEVTFPDINVQKTASGFPAANETDVFVLRLDQP